MAAPSYGFDQLFPDAPQVAYLDDYRFRSGGRNTGAIGVREIRPLEPDEVQSAIAMEIRDSLSHEGTQLAEDRRKALRYYYGKPFGNEQDGRSSFVLTDVADTIEWILPSLIRMFVGSGIIWRFKPRRPDQEEAAKQATQAVNHMFLEQMGGFMVLYDWFKTAMIEKNGIVHPYWEEKYEPKVETYYGLTEAAIGQVMRNTNVEITELRPHEGEGLYDYQTGAPIMTYDVTTLQSTTKGQMRCAGVPPEEFLITRRTTELNDDTAYAAHRRRMTVSELVTLGFDPQMLVNLPNDDTPEYDLGRTERFSIDETWTQYSKERIDPASRSLWVTHSFIRLDEDGDGYAELREILSVGDSSVQILEDKRANFMPFCSVCPVPMPHKFHGISVADLTMDLQILRSTLCRQLIDATYLANTPRYLVDENAGVDVDALLTSIPGGVVLTDRVADSVVPLATQSPPPAAFQLLEYMEGVMEKRTGATKWMTGPDASALKDSTLGGITEAMRASGQKIEMIGSIFGNTGVKQLGKNIYRLMIENSARPQVMRIHGKWVEVDPSTWGEDLDLEVEVGLGVGQAASQIMNLNMIADRQKQLLDSPAGQMLVKPRHVYNLAQTATDVLGLRLEDQFFADLGDADWPQPDPPIAEKVKLMETERRSKADAAQATIESQKVLVESATQDALQVYRAADMDHEERMKRAELVTRKDIAVEQIRAQIQVALITQQSNQQSDQGAPENAV